MDRIPVRHITASWKEPDLSENFSIRDIGGLLAGKDLVQELHRHDFFYILALENGKGIHNIDFTPYEVGDYSLFFMRPGQVHDLILKVECTGYIMQFRDEFCTPKGKATTQLIRKASNINFYQFSIERFKKLQSILTYIFLEYGEKNERYEDVIRANMDIFFIELVRQHSSSPPNGGLYQQELLDKFLELLETNILTHKQVSQYASMLSLSPYQLNAIAKTALGKTSSELINEQIILEAKRCLLATSNQVNQTAYRLGYEDVSYFIRFFKKHTGYSPEAFRNNFR